MKFEEELQEIKYYRNSLWKREYEFEIKDFDEEFLIVIKREHKHDEINTKSDMEKYYNLKGEELYWILEGCTQERYTGENTYWSFYSKINLKDLT